MRYLGGKTRLGSIIANEIFRWQNAHSEQNSAENPRGGTLVSLFCGSCAVESRIVGFDRMIINDNHPYLIAMWKGLQDEVFNPPKIVTKEDYYKIKENLNENPALSGFVGFQCSFSGKWWGGYAKGENRNYAEEGRRSALNRIALMKEHTSSLLFTCQDYRDVELPDDCVVYADPPYAGTTGYGNKFNSDEFWAFAERVSQEHRIYISEQSAPPNFVPIWEQTVTRTVDHRNNNYFKATEKLFLHERWLQ